MLTFHPLHNPYGPRPEGPVVGLLAICPGERARIQAGHLILILDTSSSMHGQKIKQLRKAARVAVEAMEGGIVSIVEFNDSPRIIVRRKPASMAKSAIHRLRAEGWTALGPAVLKAAKLLGNEPTLAILLTDGEGNIGSIKDGIKGAKIFRSRETKMLVYGLSWQWDQDQLSQIAAGAGTVAKQLDMNEMRAVFGHQARGLAGTCLSGAKLHLTLTRGLRLIGISQALLDERGQPVARLLDCRRMPVHLGNLGAENAILVEVVAERLSLGTIKLGTATLSWKGGQETCDMTINVGHTTGSADKRIFQLVNAVRAARLQQRAESLSGNARAKTLGAAARAATLAGNTRAAQALRAATQGDKRSMIRARSATQAG